KGSNNLVSTRPRRGLKLSVSGVTNLLDGAKVERYIRGPLPGKAGQQPYCPRTESSAISSLGVDESMKTKLCLFAALMLSLSSFGCQKIQARMAIKDANAAYEKEDYGTALKLYMNARQIDPSFDDLDRMIGYSQIGLYIPEDKSPHNEAHADAAIADLSRYVKKRHDDRMARD